MTFLSIVKLIARSNEEKSRIIFIHYVVTIKFDHRQLKKCDVQAIFLIISEVSINCVPCYNRVNFVIFVLIHNFRNCWHKYNNAFNRYNCPEDQSNSNYSY